jgi:hypothetical protein
VTAAWLATAATAPRDQIRALREVKRRLTRPRPPKLTARKIGVPTALVRVGRLPGPALGQQPDLLGGRPRMIVTI